MLDQIETLLDTIKQDYYDWTVRCKKGEENFSDHNYKMIQEFNEGLTWKRGQKYVKIISNRSVWGFIVKTDNDKKFKKGDILKAAGWNAPARNAARGNIIDGGYTVQWTGPLYLK